jgi:hypothetical protein
MRAGFLIVVITISASAQTREEIATLKAQVAALQSLVASLQTSNTTLQSQVGSLQTNDTILQTSDTALQTQATALQNQLTMAQPVLGSAPFVSVDPNPENGVIGPHITFKGANIHIRSKLERSRACVRMITRV